MKVLLTGWFSFEQMGATAGDLLARDVVGGWLTRWGIACDVALDPPFTGGVDWRQANPQDYSHVVFVCGPFGNGEPLTPFLERYRHCRLVGIDVTLLQPLDEWNPFDLLLERDSSRTARPDLAFVAPSRLVPVVGLVLIHPQPEYGDRDAHAEANAALRGLTAHRELGVVPIDTRLDENLTGLRTPGEVESLLARMDLVLTTRLHGMVLALRHGVPPVVVDPVQGGAKILRQAAVLEWPVVFTTEQATPEALQKALDFCLTAEARRQARETADRARSILESVESEVRRYLLK